MKKIFLSLLISLTALTVYSIPSLSGYSVVPTYLYSQPGVVSKIKVYDHDLSGFVMSMSFVRQYGGTRFETILIEAKTIVTDGTTEVNISHDYLGNPTVLTVTDNDFLDQNGPNAFHSRDLTMECQIPVAYNSWDVHLQYRYYDYTLGTWSSWITSAINFETFNVTSYSKYLGWMPSGLNQYATNGGMFPSYMPMTLIYPSNTTPVLTSGSSIYSPNGIFRLTLQTDGNLVIYKRLSPSSEQALWSTGTQSTNPNIRAAYFYFQGDGNLVLYYIPYVGSGAAWASNKSSAYGVNSVLGNNAILALQDDGNLVFYWRFIEGTNVKSHAIGNSGTQSGYSPHQYTF